MTPDQTAKQLLNDLISAKAERLNANRYDVCFDCAKEIASDDEHRANIAYALEQLWDAMIANELSILTACQFDQEAQQ